MALGRPARRQLVLRQPAGRGVRRDPGPGRATRRGFGSVRVRVTVGDSGWTTSIFPDSGRGAYVLPVKRAVREAEGLDLGDVVTVTVELVDV